MAHAPDSGYGRGRALRAEAYVFLVPGVFFLVIGIIYGFLTDFQELVGFPAILLTAGLAFLVGIYFKMLQKRHGNRPEDLHDATIESAAGDQGMFAPWSWWPLVLASGAALAFISMAFALALSVMAVSTSHTATQSAKAIAFGPTAFQRSPTPAEKQLGAEFLGSFTASDKAAEAWRQYVHVLVASNEFLFID